MIEQAAQQQQGNNVVEIFLSEWGTMGKKRPTLRFLLGLLTKAQLFRAADYVAGELLNGTYDQIHKIFLQIYVIYTNCCFLSLFLLEELPKRPQFGPAAPVDISEEIDRVLKDNEKLNENLNYKESLIFGLASQVVDDETTNNNSFERNMQSTKLISSKGERNNNNKEQLQNDKKETLNVVQVSDLIKFNSEEKNVEESRRKQEEIFDQREMSSDELPVFLNEFERSVEQTKFNREVSSEELPLFLSDSTTSSNDETSNYKTNDLSNRNVNRNEMTTSTIELPQCIVEFRVNNVFDSNNRGSCSPEDYANVAKNAVNSTELPITVLEYNE